MGEEVKPRKLPSVHDLGNKGGRVANKLGRWYRDCVWFDCKAMVSEVGEERRGRRVGGVGESRAPDLPCQDLQTPSSWTSHAILQLTYL